MPDMDSITREALKRAARMNGQMPKQDRPAQNSQPVVPENKPDTSNKESISSSHPVSKEPEQENMLDMLLSNQEHSLILLLLVLLMNEESDPSLLLALMYLLL